MENPKLKGSNIIDCIPQAGECPVKCAECFYNGGRFYRSLAEPLLPTSEEAEGKIVRVNSGHDSNLERAQVLDATAGYTHCFFNTSIPRFDFPHPVVFTCNGSRLFLVPTPANVMFVRVRTCSWNLDDVDRAVEHYRIKHGREIVLTFMRYYDRHSVLEPEDYEWRPSILNSYWCPRPEMIVRVLSRYKGTGVRMCGTPTSSLCTDCRNCELLYWPCLRAQTSGANARTEKSAGQAKEPNEQGSYSIR